MFHHRTLGQFSPLIRNIRRRFHLILLQNGHLVLCCRLAWRCYFFEFLNYFRDFKNEGPDQPKNILWHNMFVDFIFYISYFSSGGGRGIIINLAFFIPTIYTVSKKWICQLHLIFFVPLKNTSITKKHPTTFAIWLWPSRVKSSIPWRYRII